MLALSVIIPLALVRTPWICSLRVFDSFSSRFLMGTLNGWNLGRFPLLAVSLVPLYWVVWYSVQLPIFSFLKRLELCAFSQFFIWRFCLVRSSCIVFLHSILLHNFRDQGFLQQRSGGWCTASFSTVADTSTLKGKSCFHNCWRPRWHCPIVFMPNTGHGFELVRFHQIFSAFTLYTNDATGPNELSVNIPSEVRSVYKLNRGSFYAGRYIISNFGRVYFSRVFA